MDTTKRTCCGGATPENNCRCEEGQIQDPRVEVRSRYGARAVAAIRGSAEGLCCGKLSVTEQAGYTGEQIQSLPDNALNASAGCGNPTALAELRQGEVVLDLGSGGGIDVFLAANKVGPTGRVIGVDMTPEMIDLARENAQKVRMTNVEFRLGEIEHLPLADESVDVIISNCVINLSPEKESVFREAYRVLRKGGRMLVSDMMASGLPDKIRQDISAWASCIGGAIGLEEYVKLMREAGFAQIDVVQKEEYSKEQIADSIAALEQDLNEAEMEELKNSADECGEALSVSHADIRAVKN